MLDRNTAPPIKDALEFEIKLPLCQQIKLRNGVPLYFLNEGSEEVTQIEFIFEAGNSFEDKNGAAAITNTLIKSGTQHRSSFEIAQFFEFYGAFIHFSCHNEFANITLHCLSKHVKELLPAIRELLTLATFPNEELSIFQQNAIQRLSVNLLKCDFVANRLIDEYLYGSTHPYGKYNTEESIRNVNRADLVSFYDAYYKNGKCRLFAAGKLPADFEQLMEKHFGDLSLNNPVSQKTFDRNISSKKKFRIDNDPEGVQGAIRIARPFPNRHHPDFHQVKVLNTLFGGYFGSRLMTTIREEKGYTYGISSYIQNHVNDTSWMISTEAGKHVCEAAIEDIYNEMKILREERVDDEELLLVKNYLMGIHLADIDGPFNVLTRWKNLILNGLDENYYYQSIETIKSIEATDLQSMAQKYLTPENFIELVVI